MKTDRIPFNQGLKMHNDGSLPLVNELGMHEMTMSERVCHLSPLNKGFNSLIYAILESE